MSAYEQLEAHFRRIAHLDHVAAVIGWDEAAMMPPGGGDARAEAMATLSELRHQHAADPRIADLLASADEEDLDEWQRANVRQIRRGFTRARALPEELVGARSRVAVRCEQAWRRLREQNDWESFRPLLEEVVALEREAAAILGGVLGCSPYDALIDNFDPGLSQAIIDPIFADLSEFLPGFIERAVEASERRAPIAPSGPFPTEVQRQLGVRVMETLGFDFEHGRLDVSHHPFCGGVPDDVRITTRYDETDFTTGLMGIVHETGHGRYEQGLPRAWREQPVGHALGMALHESQSLFFEMQIGRSRPFMELIAPLMREKFKERAAAQPEAFTVDNLHAHYTRVERGFIRVDADEATYPTHVILRYQIERDLFAGTIGVADIPERWNVAMKEWLGLDTRGNYRDGCMQDVHWSAGLFGYFPSYTVGAITAAQLFAALRRDMPDVDDKIAAGQIGPIGAWLSERVWSMGSRCTLDELLTQATGEKLSTRYFREHLERRYLA